MFVSLFVRLSVCQSLRLSVSLFVGLYVCLCLIDLLSVCLPVCGYFNVYRPKVLLRLIYSIQIYRI